MGVSDLTITVLILVHGRREYVGQAIGSSLAQSIERGTYEVLLVTDVDVRPPEGVRAIYAEGSSGSMALAGLRAAKGDVISFLDDDDIFTPDKLFVVRGKFSGDPELGYYHNDFIPVAGDGATELPGELAWNRELVMGRGSLRYRGDLPGSIDPLLVYSNSFFNSSCISIRRSAIPGKFIEAMGGVELSLDNFLFSAALASGMGLLIGVEVLTKYRVHGSNRSMDVPYSGPRVMKDAELILGALGDSAPRLRDLLRDAIGSGDPSLFLRGSQGNMRMRWRSAG